MNYIVTGFPRSGTSMMMHMLKEGGIPVFYESELDEERRNDPNFGEPNYDPNPNGYFYYRVKQHNPYELLKNNKGKAIKIMDQDIIFEYDELMTVFAMLRDPEEVRLDTEKTITKTRIPPEKFYRSYQYYVNTTLPKLSSKPNISLVPVDYNKLMTDPYPQLQNIAQVLNTSFDVEKAKNIIDPSLYRIRV